MAWSSWLDCNPREAAGYIVTQRRQLCVQPLSSFSQGLSTLLTQSNISLKISCQVVGEAWTCASHVHLYVSVCVCGGMRVSILPISLNRVFKETVNPHLKQILMPPSMWNEIRPCSPTTSVCVALSSPFPLSLTWFGSPAGCADDCPGQAYFHPRAFALPVTSFWNTLLLTPPLDSSEFPEPFTHLSDE